MLSALTGLNFGESMFELVTTLPIGDPRDMTNETIEHFDVLIVGAGISGIGGACHLLQECPDKAS